MKTNLHLGLQKAKAKKDRERLHSLKSRARGEISEEQVDSTINKDSIAQNDDTSEHQINRIDNATKLLYYDIDILKGGTIYRKLNSEEDHIKINTDKQFEELLPESSTIHEFKSSDEYPMLKSLLLSALSPISFNKCIHVAHESSVPTAPSLSSQKLKCVVDASFDVSASTLVLFFQVNRLRKLRHDRRLHCVLLEVFGCINNSRPNFFRC